MNVNDIKLVSSQDELFPKCANTAWKSKFSNSWKECEVWSGDKRYYCLTDKIAQVYILDVDNLTTSSTFKFPLPVKSYEPDLFLSYRNNQAKRKTEGVKGYIVGNEFTTKENIQIKELKFYLTSDVKVPQSYVLNKFKITATSFYMQFPLLIETLARKASRAIAEANAPLLIEALARKASKVIAEANIPLLFAHHKQAPVCNSWRSFDKWSIVNNWRDFYCGLLLTRVSRVNAEANVPVLGNATVQRRCANSSFWSKFNNWNSVNRWSDFYCN